MKTKPYFKSYDPEISARGIVYSFKASDEAKEVNDQDLPSVAAVYEHGQWWVQVNATGASWSVVDVESNGKTELEFERL